MKLFQASPTIADRSIGRDNNFNLIRMLAAFGVMVSHAYPIALGPETLEPFEVFLKGDNLGRASVFVFFAISGFYITKSATQRSSMPAFIRARALRLFPALFVMTLFTSLVGGIWLTISDEYWGVVPSYILRTVTFSGLFFDFGQELPGLFVSNPFSEAVNGSLWSLRFEVLCYLGVVAAALLGVFERAWLFFSLALAWVALFLVIPQISANFLINTLLYVGVPFVFGSGFFVFRKKIPLSFWIAWALTGLVLISRPTFMFLPVFMLALTYWVFILGFWKQPRLEVYNRLGDYSYGFYIYAFPVQQLGAQLGMTTPILNILFALPVTLLLAAISWHAIERPSLNLNHSPRAIRQ